MRFKPLIAQARIVKKDLGAFWDGRNENLPAIASTLKAVPGRFRSLDRSQKRNLVGIGILALATQIYFIFA